ncbi:helix-turn-helix domain-containing protein [Sphingomonas oryzagri]
MLHELPIGRALRRFRRLNGIKQGHVAELLAVSQGSVSRLEGGVLEPGDALREKIVSLITACASNDADAALKRLVATSPQPVHLVCDATHRLLAASRARSVSWQADPADHIGRSLWRFASAEIVAAEQGLVDAGWFERPCQALRFHTSANHDDEIPVRPSLMQWESIPLADGRVGRLTTTIAYDRHA